MWGQIDPVTNQESHILISDLGTANYEGLEVYSG